MLKSFKENVILTRGNGEKIQNKNGTLPEQKRQETCFKFLFFFPDMYVHAYSKASYQTPLNLQELQIISGTSFPN